MFVEPGVWYWFSRGPTLDLLCCSMAAGNYKKTRFSNIYKRSKLFVCQLGTNPNILRFRHVKLEHVVAWRDKTRAWMTIQKVKTQRQMKMEIQKMKYNQKSKVLLGSGRGRGQGDKRGTTGRGHKTIPNAMAGALQGTPRTAMGCGRKRGMRGEATTSMGQIGKPMQRDDNNDWHYSKSMQGQENLRDGLECTTCRRSLRIECQRRSRYEVTLNN